MPFIFLALLIGLPMLDIYATLRFAETLGVPGIVMFLPGVIAGVMIMKRETQSFKRRFAASVQSMSLHMMVFDSGRRLLAALLFLIPGFFSDVFALFLLLIPNRSLAVHGAAGDTMSGYHHDDYRDATNLAPSSPKTGESHVVDGEYRRIE